LDGSRIGGPVKKEQEGTIEKSEFIFKTLIDIYENIEVYNWCF
jgi:hypothetical protein